MAVDNTVYDRLAQQWWQDDALPNVLRSGYNPARLGYMRRMIVQEHRIDPRNTAVLDVGAGGGLLAEEFARLGCHVTGIEPSPRSVEVARQHAAASGLPIDYRIGDGEHLPFADQTFDVVYCCDVLEHVDDLEQVIAESARVLRPGGLYLFDTINRTVRSWLVAIKLFQDWESTRFMEPDLHDWHMFIKPRELRRSLARHGLQPRQFIGLIPSPNPIAAIRLMRRRRRGELTYGQFARALGMREGRDTSVSYAGSAIKLTQPRSR